MLTDRSAESPPDHAIHASPLGRPGQPKQRTQRESQKVANRSNGRGDRPPMGPTWASPVHDHQYPRHPEMNHTVDWQHDVLQRHVGERPIPGRLRPCAEDHWKHFSGSGGEDQQASRPPERPAQLLGSHQTNNQVHSSIFSGATSKPLSCLLGWVRNLSNQNRWAEPSGSTTMISSCFSAALQRSPRRPVPE